MKKWSTFFVGVLVWVSFFNHSLSCSVVIEECRSIQEVSSFIQPGPTQLILFDIDNTLLRPRQMIGSDEWFSYYQNQLQKSSNETSREVFLRTLDLWHAIQLVTGVVPMEAETSSVVKKVQQMNCTVMGLTTRNSTLERTTIHQLNSLGISFSETAPIHVVFTLQHMPSVLFSKGVLFTSGKHKGQALKEFLRQIGWTPERILFINDKRDQLEEASEGAPPEIPFIGLRYAVSDRYVQAFDPGVAERELQQFLELPCDKECAR